MTELRERFERLVPDTEGEGNWERVLADAERPRVRRLGFVLPVAAVAAAIAIVVLAWPFGSERSAGVLDRALAAIGEGPVLHVIYRGESGPTLVDLSSGEVTPVVAESELWYDPERGVHYRSRVGSVQADRVIPRRLLSAREEKAFLALADHYRSALESGKARVIGPGDVAGRPVLWIRVWSEVRDVRGGPDHIFAEEVAVDRETSEPVYARITQDGQAEPGGARAIVKLERLSADAADFDANDPTDDPQDGIKGGGTEFGKLLAPGEFSAAVGGAAFWLGQSHDGEPLADAREFIVRGRTSRKGLYLFYGKLRRDGENFLRALSEPKAELTEFRRLPEFWISGRSTITKADTAAAQEGSVLVTNNRVYESGVEVATRTGLVLREGTYVSINAADVRTVLEAAAALRPAETETAPPSSLDWATIAEEVEARKGHTIEVTAPAAP